MLAFSQWKWCTALRRKAELVWQFVMQLSDLHKHGLFVCFLLRALSTHPVLLRENCWVQIQLLRNWHNSKRRANRANSSGLSSFFFLLGACIFSPKRDLSVWKDMVMKCNVNHSVRFQVGASQVLNRCSDYRDGHNPGIVERKQDTDLTAMHAGMPSVGKRLKSSSFYIKALHNQFILVVLKALKK